MTDGTEIPTDIREKYANNNKTIRLAAVKLEEANVRYTVLTDNARLAYVSWTVSIFFNPVYTSNIHSHSGAMIMLVTHTVNTHHILPL